MCYDGFGQLLWGKPDIMPAANLNISYTDFRKMDTLSEGDKKYAVTYGVDNERRKSVYSVNGSTVQTTYYAGNYEEQINALGNIRKIHYLSGGAVLIQNNGKDSLLYGYTDNQGSLIALTDTAGNVIEKYAYDPWGLRRNPSDWTQADSRNKWIINRGYTGQEHIDAFGIINMNGRVYDPQTAQFFSPDPFVQSAGDWLNYNRYSYVMNNPIRYTDPSGNVFEHDNEPKPLLMLSRYTPDYMLWDVISPSHHNYDAGQGMQSDEFSTYTYAICNGYTGNWKSFYTQYNEQINSPTFNGMLQIMYRYTSCSHLQLSYKISADGTMEGKFSDLCVVIKKAFINIPIGSYETTNGNALSNIASNETNGTNTNIQYSTKFIKTQLLSIVGYSNTRIKGSSSFSRSITYDIKKEEVSASNGYYTVTKDGSVTFGNPGNPVSVGLNFLTGDRIINISTPSFFATQYGINISLDSKVANTIGIIATGTIISFIPEAVIVYGFSLGGL